MPTTGGLGGQLGDIVLGARGSYDLGGSDAIALHPACAASLGVRRGVAAAVVSGAIAASAVVDVARGFTPAAASIAPTVTGAADVRRGFASEPATSAIANAGELGVLRGLLGEVVELALVATGELSITHPSARPVEFDAADAVQIEGLVSGSVALRRGFAGDSFSVWLAVACEAHVAIGMRGTPIILGCTIAADARAARGFAPTAIALARAIDGRLDVGRSLEPTAAHNRPTLIPSRLARRVGLRADEIDLLLVVPSGILARHIGSQIAGRTWTSATARATTSARARPAGTTATVVVRAETRAPRLGGKTT